MWGTTKIITIMIFGLFFPVFCFATGISPNNIDVSLDAGEQYDSVVEILNDSKINQNYQVDLYSVTIGNNLEDLSFTDIDISSGLTLSVFDSQFSLLSGDTKKLAIEINASDNVNDGTYVYAVVVSDYSDGEKNIVVSSSLVSLVFITVGDVEESINWLNFTTSKYVYFSLPATMYLTVENNGEKISQPSGTIIVHSLFGKEIAVLEINPTELRVLGNRTRTFKILWADNKSNFATGYYNLDIEVIPWKNGSVFIAHRSFIVFPVKTFGIISIFLFIFWLIIKKQKIEYDI